MWIDDLPAGIVTLADVRAGQHIEVQSVVGPLTTEACGIRSLQPGQQLTCRAVGAETIELLLGDGSVLTLPRHCAHRVRIERTIGRDRAVSRPSRHARMLPA